MGDISVEKKLELVHQLRSQYKENQSDLMNREMLLYGRTMPKNMGNVEENDKESAYRINNPDAEDVLVDDTSKLRFWLAAVLVVMIILLDSSGKSLAGISMEQIFAMIETDYEDSLDNLIEVLSQ